MFKRLSYEEWQALIPIIAFLITFAGFLVFTIRALFMQSEKAERLATLPLDTPKPHTSDSNHGR